ncbi:hypothetical protein N8198_00215 [Gammaproteobacteria bacterium]|nr:hypothetical protein [Gammaproteobacteria bacterium]
MKTEIKEAIKGFYESVENLKSLDIIRSDKYLGDIAEYISSYFYQIELAESGRQPGHDGSDNEGRVQIKYHGSPTRTNIDLGKPDEYENLLVVLGPNSMLRNPDYSGDFLLYRISASDVKAHRNVLSSSYSCGTEPFDREPDKVLDLSA